MAAVCLINGPATAQTYGLATMQPGTLAHTTGTAIAKVLKDKAGLNTLVQTTAGETVLIPMVAKGEIDLGVANVAEVQAQVEGSGPNRQADLRLIGVIHPLWASFFVRKDTTMETNADLKGKRIALGFSAMRAADMLVQAQLALGGLTAKDVTPVLVPNVIRGADDFISGSLDALYFAFGAPKVREADASVGGIRALDASASPERLAESRKLFPYGYLTPTGPAPIFVGVTRPINVYTFDFMLFTNAKAKDGDVHKIVETLANNKPDLVSIAPHLASFNPILLYKKFDMPYHPGALKYFADHKLQPVEIK
ncbi:MAG: TAXI family TRAP transporter solute-binding subunit [Xanthobacteraceae bacterium]|nr:TAXI family TRAP transporter solute-binding subunit [Xanthobacteraceae bacterium]